MITKFLSQIFKRYKNKKVFMMGNSHILNSRKNYEFIKNLNDLDYQIFSQNGEDGILDFLINRLGIKIPKFVEIGIGDYSECNSRFIYEKYSPKGLVVDCIKDLEKKVSKNVNLWKGQLEVIEKKVNSKNIFDIINSKNFFDKLDIFSIDVDGIDYWIIKELPKNFSKIAVIEYNSVFGKEKSITVPNIDDFNRTDYHYSNLCFGMSLKAAIEIMREKDFYFVGVNLMRNNAFFVSNTFSKDKYFKNLRIDNLEQIDDANFQESRNKDGKLNYLSGTDKIKEIGECEVIDLSHSSFTKIKIKNLFEFK